LAFFTIDGGQIHYQDRGRGTPALVFVHGLGCALEDWRHQVSHFVPSRRVVCLDLRGHGRSRGHASGFDIKTCGADLAALVGESGLAPAVLIGHSMGCRVVLECARTWPQSVAGLVLIDGSRLASQDADSAYRATREAIGEVGYEAFFERLFTQMFVDSSDAAVRDEAVARAGRLPRAVGLELTPAMVAWDAEFAEDALRSAKVPVKVLQSTYVNESRERVSIRPGETTPWLELVKALAPHADIETVPGVGHFTMIEATDVVNRGIEAVVEVLDRRA
jgi:pimeloyl-ACP methyl ester carboxylesterase